MTEPREGTEQISQTSSSSKLYLQL